MHWVIHLDPAGQQNLMKRCKHVNLVSSSNVDGEEEFLFAPCVRAAACPLARVAPHSTPPTLPPEGCHPNMFTLGAMTL